MAVSCLQREGCMEDWPAEVTVEPQAAQRELFVDQRNPWRYIPTRRFCSEYILEDKLHSRALLPRYY